MIKTDNIRNLCLIGNGGSGKTSLAEAMLFRTNTIDRLGTPTAGNTVCDFGSEAIKRGFSIGSAVAAMNYKDVKINLIDTPGALDFVGEVHTALRVTDSAIILLEAKSGRHVGTDLAWEKAEEAGRPKAFFINKSDEKEANFAKIIDDLCSTYGSTVCPVFVPTGVRGEFADILGMKKYTYGDGATATESDIDAGFFPTAEAYRERLFEAIASTDEGLMEKFFGGEEISRSEANTALAKGIAERSITPIYSGSSTKLWGVDVLLSAVADSFPSPLSKKTERIYKGDEIEEIDINSDGDPGVFVFKTSVDQYGRQAYFKVMRGELKNGANLKNVPRDCNEKFANFSSPCGKKLTPVDSLVCGDIGVVNKLVDTKTGDTLVIGSPLIYERTAYPPPNYTMAVISKGKGDEDKVAQGMYKLAEEDRTIKFENNTETKQLLVSGMGDMHLDVLASRLKSRNGAEISLIAPKTAYRETIKKKVQVEGKHKKQSGGNGQYGHVKITFSPGSEPGLTFTTSVVGGSVPKNYFPAVEKGLQESMLKGVLAGYPVVNLAADLYDGSYHDVDSNELSFKLAANLAYRNGLPNASPILLEPVGQLNVTIPDGVVGDVIGDINGKRRGSVLGMNPATGKRGYTTIEADIPKAEMADYTISLRAMTQGKGSYVYEISRYEEVPGIISQKIIAEAQKSEG